MRKKHEEQTEETAMEAEDEEEEVDPQVQVLRDQCETRQAAITSWKDVDNDEAKKAIATFEDEVKTINVKLTMLKPLDEQVESLERALMHRRSTCETV